MAGKHLLMNMEELQVHGSALVTSIEDCPEIADGEGSVVTAKFLTREVNTIARVEILGVDGQVEVLEGTIIHPIWSVDRNDWVLLGELIEGETLSAANGVATVVSIALVNTNVAVYNIEVLGEHVYQVGELGLLVHNTCAGFNDAMTDALNWLGTRGFNSSTAKAYKSKFSDALNGMKDGKAGYRIEFDQRSGAHINVFAGKEIGPHFKFGGNAADVAAVLRQLFGG
jgi:hypothetical protein